MLGGPATASSCIRGCRGKILPIWFFWPKSSGARIRGSEDHWIKAEFITVHHSTSE